MAASRDEAKTTHMAAVLAQACAHAIRQTEKHRSSHIIAELDKIGLEMRRVMPEGTSDVSLDSRSPSDSEWSPNQSTSSESESEDDGIVQRYFEDTSIFGERLKARWASPRLWGAICVPPGVVSDLLGVRCGRLASKLRKVEKLLLQGSSTEAGEEAGTGDASSEEQLRNSQALPTRRETNEGEDAPAASIFMPLHATSEPRAGSKVVQNSMSKIVWRDAQHPTAAGPAAAASRPVFRRAPDLPKTSRQDCGAAAISGVKWRENSDIARRRELTLGCKLDDVMSSDASGRSPARPQTWIQAQLASSDDKDSDDSGEAGQARNKLWTEARKFSAVGEHARATRNFSGAFSRSREKLVTSKIAAALLADE